jgi:hypothetical protein
MRAIFLLAIALIASAAARAQTALPDLGAGLYLGQYQGGLYPGGANTSPPAHAAAALAQAAQVVPRDAAGVPSGDGLIGMVCLGMSNASQEFEDLERALDARSDRNARLVIVNTCAGGQAAENMDEASDLYWTTIAPLRMAAAGVSANQVQVAWMKQIFASAPTTTFPAHAQALRDTLKNVVQFARTRYPNLRLLYLSNRIYGGFGSVPPNGEPYTYETGFAQKWLIEDQINGDAALNYDPANGTVRAPLLLWGPNLWANGSTPNGQGTTWVSADYEADNLHPSASGEAKVGALLLGFFDAEASATWLAPRADSGLSVVPVQSDAYVAQAAPTSNFGAATELRIQGSPGPQRSFMRFAAGSIASALVHAKLVVRDVNTGLGPTVTLVGDSGWDENTITWNNAPALDGGVLSSNSGWTRENCPSFDLTGTLLNDADGLVSVAFDTNSPSQQTLYSREGAASAVFAPQLVLTLRSTDAVFADGFE